MSARDIKAGGAFVEISARDKVDAGLKSAMGKLKAFEAGALAISASLARMGTALTAAGGSILGALAGFAKQFADVGSRLNDMSERTGMSVEALSELKFAAEQSGASLEDVEAGLKFMAKSGFRVEQFDMLADKIGAIADPSMRAAAAIAIFGRGGTKLIPMLTQLQALRGEARASGLVISEEEARKADKLGDSLDKLVAIIKSIGINIGSAVAGPLIQILEFLSPIVAQFSQWVKENGMLVVGLGAVAAVLVVIGGGLLAAAGTLAVLSFAGSALLTIFGALISPVGLVVAGIVALAGGLGIATGAWVAFNTAALGSINGILDAILSGNITNAWQQMAVTMQDIWLRMVRFVKAAFWELGRWILGLATSVMHEFSALIGEIEDRLGVNLGGHALGSLANGMEAGFVAVRGASIGKTDDAIRANQQVLSALRQQARQSRERQMDMAAAGLEAARRGGNDGSENQPFAPRSSGVMGGAFGSFQGFRAELAGRAGERTKEKDSNNIAKLVKLFEKNDANQGQIIQALEDLEIEPEFD